MIPSLKKINKDKALGVAYHESCIWWEKKDKIVPHFYPLF
jgi:hypothetical protein